ncbi:beta/alpha barrel domain-containing protein [Flavobacterium gawalongense]|uniref:Bifunctional 4-hydroxy-2-oxoglutarate aldolase/2-dehydro-3-deoxy-phosphogluconate aldolase n=1 Tax=Flavobacterium gawalongense TaxID=2594432 RepID=A0A553BAM9_9FLAO|nr:bifunctional 4-hydroxy-2-oxoglutarate aldolase/2-dehydro-3-deoxy-phosphogluconate aldolase [Flavobacterium gawalongense]TRX05305.1 bifunctional 4-hydroxy-2-oxoglutarate aldolase/2-dehydro-3-deoxy-phosphogluconate aldolase [Flavobacterium gawalongense]TRX08556.1 bifunctional 4-hydroxy-2-oxoglutarate aldolase/2-dehydro-3-deoxy-phosphogluconate aldolase [Flavobacterium gawalongense]TRX24884.1 bifunctional 4-hydroxy-2-oxoglutarate aldolase/2-dehydro-3-deoxy-phosphogluconate aldolase [Flavobacteri
MKNIQQVTDTIVQQGILPLYFNTDETISVEVLKAIYKAGIKAVEYTHRGDTALNNFKALVKLRNLEMPGLLIGIGTIKNLNQAKEYLEAGADFIISPGFVLEIASYTLSNDIFYGPGCMTPSDIIAAENAGIRFIKLFPGNILGIEFLNSIKDIFPNLLFMPTGGVDATKESIEAWYKAGVCAVGMGSKLISKTVMDQKEYQSIENNTTAVLHLIQTIKNK